jgi:Protein of unknown function (DUF1559)
MRSWPTLMLLAVLSPIADAQETPPGGSPAALQERPESEKQARELAKDRLKKLGVAFHGYVDEHKTFPPAALVAKDGKVLLSWRVLLLPYLGEEQLYRQFKLTEPWDSPHNIKLLSKMPTLFAPNWGKKVQVGATPWQVFTGPQTIFEGTAECRISDITDGTSTTLLVVEAARLVPWSKPEDLTYDAQKEIPSLGYMFPGVFLFACADGSPYIGRRDFKVQAMRNLIRRNDGNILAFQDVLAKNQP